MMNDKSIAGNGKSGWACVKARRSPLVAADVSRRSGRSRANCVHRGMVRTTEQVSIVIEDPPTHVGSYGATGAVNGGAPNPESSISKSLICRRGLLQVVDFHDFSRYFLYLSMLGERDQPAKRAALMLFRLLGRCGMRLAPRSGKKQASRDVCSARRQTRRSRRPRSPRIGFQCIRVSSRSIAIARSLSLKFNISLRKSLISMKVSVISSVSLIESLANPWQGCWNTGAIRSSHGGAKLVLHI
jgi:hypothetical protein